MRYFIPAPPVVWNTTRYVRLSDKGKPAYVTHTGETYVGNYSKAVIEAYVQDGLWIELLFAPPPKQAAPLRWFVPLSPHKAYRALCFYPGTGALAGYASKNVGRPHLIATFPASVLADWLASFGPDPYWLESTRPPRLVD